jgi:predicted TIM-barrel fold metal-dependent hydrolase
MVALREALDLGCAAIEIPAYPVGPRSITHVDHEPFYALLAEAGVPLLFHLGSGGENPPRVYRNTGREVFVDPDGNSDPVRPLRVVGLAPPVEMALAALVFDGVLDRHPTLKVGAIELGAVWVPGFLRRLDLSVKLDKKMRQAEHAPGDLDLLPSEYITRQVRFTPFTDEPLDWVIGQTDPSMYMFSSDYPHAEGGGDPYGEFKAALGGFDDTVHEQFFRTNFEWFLGDRLASTR